MLRHAVASRLAHGFGNSALACSSTVRSTAIGHYYYCSPERSGSRPWMGAESTPKRRAGSLHDDGATRGGSGTATMGGAWVGVSVVHSAVGSVECPPLFLRQSAANFSAMKANKLEGEMKPALLWSARKVVNARSYRILLSPESFSTCALRDSQSAGAHRGKIYRPRK